MNDKIKGLAGFENLEDDAPSIPYIRILNGSAATEADLQAGVIVGKDGVVLAEKDTAFRFIPIYLFSRWTIWNNETRTMVKFTTNKRGPWSDGSPVLAEDINWVNNQPPRATESFDVVVLPEKDLALPEGERQFYMLSIPKRNKQKAEFVKEFKSLLRQVALTEGIELFGGIYSFKAVKTKDDKGNVWFEFANITFEGKVEEDKKKIGARIYDDVKNMNSMAITPVLIEAGDSAPDAVVVENTEF
jgi:hypothetical protein